MTDVWLDDDAVVVSGTELRSEAPDLVVDNSGRRSDRNRDGRRRALVHDPNDGLTVNWKSDYPGGVTVFGPVRITGGRQLRCETTDFELDNKDRRGTRNSDLPRRALVHDDRDGLTINWSNDYPAGVRIRGPVTVVGDFAVQSGSRSIDIVEVVRRLEAAVEALTRRVATLEGRG